MIDFEGECIQCGSFFMIKAAEYGRIRNKGFDLPKRCPDCRKNKKKVNTLTSKRRQRDQEDSFFINDFY